jgi:hypothetical protein
MEFEGNCLPGSIQDAFRSDGALACKYKARRPRLVKHEFVLTLSFVCVVTGSAAEGSHRR